MKVADMMSNKADSLTTAKQPSAIFLKQQLDQKITEARHICDEWGVTVHFPQSKMRQLHPVGVCLEDG